MAVPPLLGQDPPRKTKFQSLHHDGRILLLRFADQQMNVFGHNHVAEVRVLVYEWYSTVRSIPNSFASSLTLSHFFMRSIVMSL
jgi:hypothetical protein